MDHLTDYECKAIIVGCLALAAITPCLTYGLITITKTNMFAVTHNNNGTSNVLIANPKTVIRNLNNSYIPRN